MLKTYYLDVKWADEQEWQEYFGGQPSLKTVLGIAKGVWESGRGEVQIWDQNDVLLWKNGRRSSPFDCLSQFEMEWLAWGGVKWPMVPAEEGL